MKQKGAAIQFHMAEYVCHIKLPYFKTDGFNLLFKALRNIQGY